MCAANQVDTHLRFKPNLLFSKGLVFMQPITKRIQMNLDWDKFKKEKLAVEFLEICDEFERMDSTQMGVNLKAEILKDWDSLEFKDVPLQDIYEAAKITHIAETLFQKNGINPTEEQLSRQSAVLLTMVKKKESTLKELMAGMTVH